MSSAKKGDLLEENIFRLFKTEIKNKRFYVQKEYAKVFRKKGYYSKDRDGKIIFDVSIEATLPGQKKYSHLVLIECKNYSHPVPVDDVEEFHSKIQQISGDNIKGIIASTNSFQKGAFTFAESKGLGLLRYFNQAKFKYELPRSSSGMVTARYAQNNWVEAFKGLSTEKYKPSYFDCYGYAKGEYTNSLRLLFLGLLGDGNARSSGAISQLAPIINPINDNIRQVPYREENEIEKKASQILQKIKYKDGPVPLDLICEIEGKLSGLNVTRRDAGPSEAKILGKIRFLPPEITIFKHGESSEMRERFTIAHELGHYFMGHSKYMSGEYCEKADFEFENPLDLGIKDIMRMEWQANHFASCLLLPKEQFVRDFKEAVNSLGVSDRGFGILFLDKQPVNIRHYLGVSRILENKYNVSRTVVKIRLKKLGLLNEAGQGKS